MKPASTRCASDVITPKMMQTHQHFETGQNSACSHRRPQPNHGLDDRAYFTDCAAWAGRYFGGAQNIVSVDVHRDEVAPHCHVLLVPLRDGRMAGSAMMGNRLTLLATHDHFHGAVAAQHGLGKAPARLSGTAKHAVAAAVLQRLKATSDPVLRSPTWATMRDAIENDPGPFALALGIESNAPRKRLRSMTAIFTSKGKGKASEANPIGFTSTARTRTLSCVGFAPESPAPEAAWPAPAPAANATVESYPRRRPVVACDERTADAVGNSVGPLPVPTGEVSANSAHAHERLMTSRDTTAPNLRKPDFAEVADFAHAREVPNEPVHDGKVAARVEAPDGTTRVRDCDLDPAGFDPITGEHFPARSQPARLNRTAAEAWVSASLNKKAG